MSGSKQSQTSTNGMSDAALIASSNSDAAFFGVVFDRHVDRIYAFVLRRVGKSLAEDLTAETFARAFEQRARFVPTHENAGPWLYGIATNVVHKAWRAERRQLAAYRRTAVVVVAAEDDLGVAEDRIDAERAAAILVDSLAVLEQGDRDALLLFVWEELSYEDVGAALGIPTGTVASRINRARRQLRAAQNAIGEPSKGAV